MTATAASRTSSHKPQVKDIWLGEADYASTSGTGAKIDRDANMIRGVKFLGLTSQNGRHYLPETLRRALPLYEGAPIYFNHQPKGSTADRPYEDRFGEACNVRLTESGMWGDIKFNPKHPRAEQVIYDIENNTPKVGFSPDHYGDGPIRNGKRIVESINRVKSIDIVANPATNRSFSESEGNHDMELAEQLAESRANETKLMAELASLKESVTKLTTDNAALTAKAASLQESVDASAAEVAKAKHKTAVAALLKEHKIPEKAQTPKFVALLESATIESATDTVKELAETLKTAGGSTVRAASGTPISESQKGGGDAREVTDGKSFAAAVRG
jgi:regulator of replication initiation timing